MSLPGYADASLKHLSYAALREKRGRGRTGGQAKAESSIQHAAAPAAHPHATAVIVDKPADADCDLSTHALPAHAEGEVLKHASKRCRVSPEVLHILMHIFVDKKMFLSMVRVCCFCPYPHAS